MKTLAVLLLVSINFLRPVESPKTWVFLNPSIVTDLEPYNTALANANLDRLRYVDVRNTIHFENGLNVELYSANEVIAMGLPVNTSHVRQFAPSAYKQSTFKLMPSGLLVEHPPMQKTK